MAAITRRDPNHVDDFFLYSHLESILSQAGKGGNGLDMRFSKEQIDQSLLAQGIAPSDLDVARKNAIQGNILVPHGNEYGLSGEYLSAYCAANRRI